MKTDAVVDLVLGRDMLSVTHPDGTQLHFTRQERALLLRLASNPGRLMPRVALAAAIGSDATELAGDRHIDLLINQLRRKLGDHARAPRYIRTQYGEGYTWIGPVPPADPDGRLLRLGTVYGREAPGAADVTLRLDEALQERLAGDGGRYVKSSFCLDVSFHDDGQRLRAALVLRDGATAAMLETFRLSTGGNDDPSAIATVADAVVHSLWSHAALPSATARLAPNDPPPWVKLFEAALMMDGDLQTWKSNGPRLEDILAADPGNLAMKLMRGLNLYLRLIQSFRDPSGQIVGEAEWRMVEDEIEEIALASLAHFDDQPVMQLAAAKLLLFINRGYLHLSRRVADDVLANSSAHAAAFALAGEASGFAGDSEQSSTLIARALELSQAGSQFQIYLLVVEASTLFAARDMAGFDRVCRLTRDLSPGAYATLQSFCCLEGYETAPLFRHVISADAGRAREAIRYLWNVTGRRFARRGHRRNLMAPMTKALVRLYGDEVIPPEVISGTGLGAAIAPVAGP